MIKEKLFRLAQWFLFPNKGITHIKREQKIIVSLTSYPRRIMTVAPVIDSLLHQSLKPDMVILWLAEEEFPQKEHSLPKRLRKYIKFGLQIKWCENLKSYKKLIPALLEYPDDIIVTADDDIRYPENWLEILYIAHLIHSNEILCHYAYQPHFEGQFTKSFPKIIKTPGVLTDTQIIGSGGGALFPPHSLYKDITQTKLFNKIAPHNDDYWIWAMAKLSDTPMRLVDKFMDNIVCIDGTQETGLWQSVNQQESGIDEFTKIIQTYPILQQKISHTAMHTL